MKHHPRTALSWLAAVGLGAFAAACFSPPSANVMFTCDLPADDAACPPGYHCAPDGCCHRDGTDDTVEAGACGASGTSAGATTATDTGISSSGGATGETSTSGTATDTGSDTGTAGSGDTSTSGAASGAQVGPRLAPTAHRR